MTKQQERSVRPEAPLRPADQAGVARAAEVLAQGGLAVFPTETVYGLGADARNDSAVAGIFEAKGRPGFNPLIVHVADLALAQTLAELPKAALDLARVFWPGALTLVVPVRPDAGLSARVTAGLSTVGLRVPSSPVAQDVLRVFGGPVAAPSANPSGRISPTSAQHVAEGLGGSVDIILDGGECPVGLESTIVGFDPVPTLLRPGGVTIAQIEAVLGQRLSVSHGSKITAPGQLLSHYAPSGAVRLNATTPEAGEFMIGFGAINGDITLSATGSLDEAAARLFWALHEADRRGATQIAVAPVPQEGIGVAINDRLKRAAAPRD